MWTKVVMTTARAYLRATSAEVNKSVWKACVEGGGGPPRLDPWQNMTEDGKTVNNSPLSPLNTRQTFWKTKRERERKNIPLFSFTKCKCVKHANWFANICNLIHYKFTINLTQPEKEQQHENFQEKNTYTLWDSK